MKMVFLTREFTMKLEWALLLLVFHNWHCCNGANTNVSKRPEVVNIGSIFSFKSMVGKVAKVAIEAAIQDVNSYPDVLRGTELKITMNDANFSGFRGIVEGTLHPPFFPFSFCDICSLLSSPFTVGQEQG
ncbi:hypothetical protein LguiA_005578 [Lonicera macranthoides]